MPLPLRDFVQQVLLENNRAGKIYNAIASAWNLTVESYPERATWLRKSSFRGLVWESAIRQLAMIEQDDPDFKLVSHRDTVSFVIENAVLLRFKHADVSLTTANFPTVEAIAFDSHDVDLYGFSGLQRVELCYVLNEFETDLIWIGVSARSNGRHIWKIELTKDGVLAPAPELPMFNDEHEIEKLANIKKNIINDLKKKKDNG